MQTHVRPDAPASSRERIHIFSHRCGVHIPTGAPARSQARMGTHAREREDMT